MPSTIIGDLSKGFSDQLGIFMAQKSGVVIGVLTGPVTKLFVITLIIWLVLVAFGQVEDTVFGAIKKFLKIVIFSVLVLNVGNYLKYIANPIREFPVWFAGLFIDGGYVGSYMLLDNALTQGADLAIRVKNLGGGINPGTTLYWALVEIFFVWIPTMAMVFFGALVLFLTEFYLNIVLLLGPLFIICLFWRGTKIQFELWLKQVLTLVLTTSLAFIAISVVFKLWSAQIDVAMAHPENGISQFLPMLMVSFIGFAGLWQSPMIARGLGGGWHLDVYAAASTLRGVAFSPVDRFARTAGNRIERTFTRERSPRNENNNSQRGDDTRNWPTETDPVHNHYQNHHHHGGNTNQNHQHHGGHNDGNPNQHN